jgi:hypothetical protein
MRAVEGNLGHSSKKMEREEGPRSGYWLVSGKSNAKTSGGQGREKYLPVGGRVRKRPAVENQSGPISQRD